MSREHVLLGLEPDNLLAFLALLGFHRALDQAAPDWNARTYWAGGPLRPRLVLSKDVSRAEVLDAAGRGCGALAEAHSFRVHKDIDYTGVEARRELGDACRTSSQNGSLRMDMLTALMNDKAVKDDGKVRATPFCTLFGQGHQHFLERLENVAKGVPPKDSQKELTERYLNSVDRLEEALFTRWDRKDRTQSFRWDPLEDRRYALRFEDPSSDKGMTVHGANRLASVAIALLPAVPRKERGEVRLYAVGTSWNRGSGLRVCWPI